MRIPVSAFSIGLPTEAVTVGRTYRFADWSHPDSNATWPPFCVPTQPYTPQHVSHQRRIDIVPHVGEPYGRDSFAPHQPLRSKDVTAAPSLPWLHQHWGTERKSGFHGPPFAPFGFGMSYAKVQILRFVSVSLLSTVYSIRRTLCALSCTCSQLASFLLTLLFSPINNTLSTGRSPTTPSSPSPSQPLLLALPLLRLRQLAGQHR